MRVTISVQGLPAAAETLDRRHGPRLNRSVGRASMKALRAIRPAVQAAAPVLTGRTRRNVRVARATGDAKPGGYIGISRKRPGRGAIIKRNPFVVRTANSHRGVLFSTFWLDLRTDLNK